MKQQPDSTESNTAVALNSVRHGLQTVALVIPGLETEAEWRDFTAGLLDAFAPEGAVERAFAGRIVELLWRLRRAARAEHKEITEDYEAACRKDQQRVRNNIDAQRELPDNYYASPLDTEPREISAALLPREAALNQIIRYEAHLSRQLFAAMHELEALQARRSGQTSPLLRLRIHGPAL